jgi:hypothetical protein
MLLFTYREVAFGRAGLRAYKQKPKNRVGVDGLTDDVHHPCIRMHMNAKSAEHAMVADNFKRGIELERNHQIQHVLVGASVLVSLLYTNQMLDLAKYHQ